jgi:hypothetical protein
MKQGILLLFISMVYALGVSAQINLVHTFPKSDTKRVILGPLGEKYVVASIANRAVEFYNKDFSLWKSVPLNDSFPETLLILSLDAVYYDLIDEDQKPEFKLAVSGFTDFQSAHFSIWMNTDGEGISVPGGVIEQVNGKSKLVHDNEVYALPGLALEHTFPAGTILNIAHSSTGDYYYYQTINPNQIYIHDDAFNVLKVVDLGPCASCAPSVYGISDNLVNNSADFEIIVGGFNMGTNKPQFQVVDEGNQSLFATDVSDYSFPFWLDKQQTQLTSDYFTVIDYIGNTTLYSLPDFNLIHTFENERIYPTDPNTEELVGKFKPYKEIAPESSSFSLYNEDFSVYKTVPKTVGEYWILSNASVSWFNPDSKIEFLLLAIDQNLYKYEYQIINEDGDIQFKFPSNSVCALSRLPGAADCVICNYPQGAPNNPAFATTVFSLPSAPPLAITESIDNQNITITPNPVGAFDVTVEFDKMPESDIHVRLYDVTGRAVYTQRFPAANTVRIPNAAFKQTGIYWLEIQSGGQKSVGKLVKMD